MGSDSVHSHTFVYEAKEDCIVCSNTVQKITVPSNQTTLNELIQLLKDTYQLMKPSIISSSGTTLYMQKPPMLEQATRPNLDKPLSTLIDDITTEELTITDPLLESISLTISIRYESIV
jgi:ubiquitin-activating enzyme E1 C